MEFTSTMLVTSTAYYNITNIWKSE